MGLLPRDAELATGIDVALLGVIAFGIFQTVRTVTAVPARTPDLLRLSAGSAGSATAPELGLLRPREAGAAPALDLGGVHPEPVWTALSLAALAVVVGGPLWFWVVRPYRDRS